MSKVGEHFRELDEMGIRPLSSHMKKKTQPHQIVFNEVQRFLQLKTEWEDLPVHAICIGMVSAGFDVVYRLAPDKQEATMLITDCLAVIEGRDYNKNKEKGENSETEQ